MFYVISSCFQAPAAAVAAAPVDGLVAPQAVAPPVVLPRPGLVANARGVVAPGYVFCSAPSALLISPFSYLFVRFPVSQ